MFEGSLVESRGMAVSRAQRWSAVGSAAFQLVLAAVVVIIPLMRPQTMKLLKEVPHLTAPPVPVRPPEPMRVDMSNMQSTEPTAPATFAQASSGTHFFPIRPGIPTEDGPPGPIGPIAMDGGPAMPGFSPMGIGPTIAVTHTAPSQPVNVSKGVSEGLLLAPIRPVYPEIAKVTRTQGTVVVEALISKAGKIESAHAISGPPILRQAAVDAVAEARYRPYLLSGEPVEVQTTVTVVFRLGE